MPDKEQRQESLENQTDYSMLVEVQEEIETLLPYLEVQVKQQIKVQTELQEAMVQEEMVVTVMAVAAAVAAMAAVAVLVVLVVLLSDIIYRVRQQYVGMFDI